MGGSRRSSGDGVARKSINQGLWDRWAHAYTAVSQGLPHDQHMPCPSCGKDALRLVFLTDAGAATGYARFWCSNCLKGMRLGPAPIPEGAEVIPRSLTPAELASV